MHSSLTPVDGFLSTLRRYASALGWAGTGRQPLCHRGCHRHVCALARWMAADLYYNEVDRLGAELSEVVATDELRAKVGDAAEPYRALLDLRGRLDATRQHAEAELDALRSEAPATDRSRTGSSCSNPRYSGAENPSCSAIAH